MSPNLAALILILFLELPAPLLACWRSRSLDRRPAWLALGLMELFIVGLYIPVVRNYLGFASLAWRTWRDMLVGLIIWAAGLLLLLRNSWMDRLQRSTPELSIFY